MKYKCPICEKTFNSKNALRFHTECDLPFEIRIRIIEGYLLDKEIK